ncbi:hypothetical protein TNIN_17991 [Trichonephila inaurata madagascariensis]|uniref:Uncharacterized protein n=1 Tax=Trichonephila inaurata madagascariensis TaxID=2747483 RepID=A0A8X6X319_9ARAC|nr:hypothetical protein TNIN_17991 [Trichonephila inaurata madagascariensis]
MVSEFSDREKVAPHRLTSQVKCAENRRVYSSIKLTDACPIKEQLLIGGCVWKVRKEKSTLEKSGVIPISTNSLLNPTSL